jgi:parvulin-like peptidyl-prolyl isomerase
MWAALIEASGSEIFREILLSRAIQHALTQEQLPEITQEEIDYEKNVLVRTLQNNNASDLDLVLAQRGYGEKRLHTLCQRNAGLRKLVQPKIKVTDASVLRMFALIHGPKFPVQIIVTSTLEQASQARQKIRDGERFSTVAATLSIDPSAMRGGVVAPISPADPLWPTSIRELIQTLDIGTCSPPVLIEDRWVIITVIDHPITQTVDLSDVRDEMKKLSRLAMEQLEMDQLSKRLRTTMKSNIIDLELKRALNQE